MPNIPNMPNTDSKSNEMPSYRNEKHHEGRTTTSAIEKLRSEIGERPRRTSVTDQYRIPRDTRGFRVMAETENGNSERVQPRAFFLHDGPEPVLSEIEERDERDRKISANKSGLRRLLASIFSYQRDHGYRRFQPTTDQSLPRQERRELISLVSSTAGKAENPHVSNQPVSDNIALYEKDRSQVESKDLGRAMGWRTECDIGARQHWDPTKEDAKRKPEALGKNEVITDGGWNISDIF